MTEDILSGLPDPIIHHIFSFLDMKQVVQTSLLSRRWRYVWVSNPYLHIDCYMWMDNENDFKHHQFKNFVNQILLNRDGSSIQKFYLNCDCYGNLDEFDTWITYVIKRNVQEVKLVGMKILELTLKSLAGQLKILILESVALSDVDSSEELLLNTPVMEHLAIDDFDYKNHKRFTIYAPKLQYLFVNDPDGKGNTCHIKLDTPNLTVLGISGYMFESYSLGNLSALLTADIDLITSYEDKGRIDWCLKNILHGLVFLESLTLSAIAFQIDTDTDTDMLKMVDTSFCNLRHLRFTKWCSTGYIFTIVKLLESFPYLETLVLERIEIVLDPKAKGGDWEAQLLSQCMLCHLKYIEIQDTEGSENELKFLEFLLKIANALEIMTIIPTRTRSREKQKLVQFCKKLQMVHKASSTAKLLLKEWNFVSHLN